MQLENTDSHYRMIEMILILSACIFAYNKDRVMSHDNKIISLIISVIISIGCPFLFYAMGVIYDIKIVEAIFTILFSGLMIQNKKNREVISYFLYPGFFYSCCYMTVKYHLGFSGMAIATLLLFLLYKKSNLISFKVQYIITNMVCSLTLFIICIAAGLFRPKGFYASGTLILLTNAAIFIFTHKDYKNTLDAFGFLLVDILLFGITVGNILKLGLNFTSMISILVFFILAGISFVVKKIYPEKKYRRLRIYALVLSFILSILYTTNDHLIVNSVMAIVILLDAFLILYLSNIFEKKNKTEDVLSCILVTSNLITLSYHTVIWNYTILLTVFLMIIAALFISIGFYTKRKGIRLYGLTLLILSVIKMILVDSSGNDPIVRIVGLVAGGVICLIVSYIYNKLEKRLIMDEE